MRAIALVLLAACGAQPNQPVLANVPKPNTAGIAGGAAAAAAAITLASPDSHTPEKKQDEEKKPIKVKEHVPAATLDRLDQAPPPPTSDQDAKQPAGNPKTEQRPRDGLDFGGPSRP